MDDYDRIGATAMFMAVAAVAMFFFAIGFVAGIVVCITY